MWHCYLKDEVSWRPKFNRTWCPNEAKTVRHQTCLQKTNSEVVNKTISPETAAVKWLLIMNLLSVQP